MCSTDVLSGWNDDVKYEDSLMGETSVSSSYDGFSGESGEEPPLVDSLG